MARKSKKDVVKEVEVKKKGLKSVEKFFAREPYKKDKTHVWQDNIIMIFKQGENVLAQEAYIKVLTFPKRDNVDMKKENQKYIELIKGFASKITDEDVYEILFILDSQKDIPFHLSKDGNLFEL